MGTMLSSVALMLFFAKPRHQMSLVRGALAYSYVTDVVFVSFLVYYTGGISSDMYLLYCLLAFKAATFAQVPAACQELVLIGMKAHTASFRGLDRIFDYINHGPKGKSGKENIPDPFAGLR